MKSLSLVIVFAVLYTCLNVATGQTKVCNSTGWRCKDDCTGLGNGYNQWCGACGLALQCISEQTYYYYCAADHKWDDEEVFCVTESKTCSECYDEVCGGGLHNMTENKYGVKDGWDAMCYIDSDDPNADKPCDELIRDMNGIGGGATEFVDAGGDFGCWRGRDGMDGDYRDGCRSAYGHKQVLADCEECNIMAVCIRYP